MSACAARTRAPSVKRASSLSVRNDCASDCHNALVGYGPA